ncbi:hypothetical protein SMACR_02073 [Sordaria macrospora]|uniref:Uncharacterized protein n=1 Tax=Sordaria macrospora TaxID=5147 RepID=A0A8S8ZU50_SORMA|nr:hypothetical protein SMACR_02073 [Sordaria macrospora]WPJ63848.1 hypothetical protein SMAC4_02073 [Sordaria macrospora]
MEKCWFPLRDTHFPPPSLESMRSGSPSSPAPSLGHLIPSLNRLDQIINADGFEPFPPATMEIWGPTLIEDFSWDQSLTQKSTVKLKASAPLAGAVIPGAELGVGVGAAFSKSVGNYWEFDRLERYIVQPTRSYVQRCIERDDVKRWIAKNKKLGGRWEVYMVTGIMVARGGGRKRKRETSEKGVFAEVTVTAPGCAALGGKCRLPLGVVRRSRGKERGR